MAVAEGVSFLLLLGVAMPLKYFAQMPEAVKIAGMIHGVLFIAFIGLAMEAMGRLNKNLSWLLLAFVSAIVPLGAFYFEKRWLQKD